LAKQIWAGPGKKKKEMKFFVQNLFWSLNWKKTLFLS